MSDDIVSIALVGYLPTFGNNFMRAVFAGWFVVGVKFTCMACGDVGLQIYTCINLFRHVGNLSNLAFPSSVFLHS